MDDITHMFDDVERITKVNIEEEMKTAYIDYSMSVIVSRALPDVRDGLKPVHRRVLFGMSKELGLYSDKPHKKSARIVGEVLGKLHPHGDSSVYDAMVRMAQWWSLRYPLVDGQGNFGSIDGDSPAAMRYTEARMKKITDEVMADIEKDTVDHMWNFDDSIQEPTVLPTKIPLLLVNGASGIAVGMATNMAPHNLGDSIDAICSYIDNPDINIEELISVIKAPDFPTGGIIYGYEGVREAYLTGRGRVVIRAKTEIETTASGRTCIVVTEIPYQVNKAEMVKKIAELVNEKKIEGISYINDETDRNGMRVVIILKNDAVASVVLNNLYKYSQLQYSFPINNIALVEGRPRQLNLKQIIKYFVRHRHDVIMRRTRYDLAQAQKRAHIIRGLLVAQDNIDEVINIIRSSSTPDEARQTMSARFGLDDIQTQAIIEMRLRALTGLERGKLQNELDQLEKDIAYYNQILVDEQLQMKIIKDELLEIKQKYNDERRTQIEYSAEEFDPESLLKEEDMVITISNLGYVKRTSLSEYRLQSRGGTGSRGSSTREEDYIEHLYVTTTHNTLLLFTEKGRCYWLKVYEIPEVAKNGKGRAIQNLLQIEPDDRIRAIVNVRNMNDRDYIESHFIVMVTSDGIVKKTALSAYANPRQKGIIAITIREGDTLVDASLTSGNSDIILASSEGKSLRFKEDRLRAVGRGSMGVKGMSLPDGIKIVGVVVAEPDQLESVEVLALSSNGYGKRTGISDYRVQARGGKGIKTMQITEKTGELVSIQAVNDNFELLVINRSGIIIRTGVDEIRQTGRSAQGVKVITLRNDDVIASVVSCPRIEDDSRPEEENPSVETVASEVSDDNLPQNETTEKDE